MTKVASEHSNPDLYPSLIACAFGDRIAET